MRRRHPSVVLLARIAAAITALVSASAFQPAPSKSFWNTIDIRGSLLKHIYLGSVRIDGSELMGIVLTCAVREDPIRGEAVTNWTVPALQSWFVPHIDGSLEWKRPGGEIVKLPQKLDADQLSQRWGDWKATYTPDLTKATIVDSKGVWCYNYVGGWLHEVIGPGGDLFAIESNRGAITAVYLQRGNQKKQILSAQYNDRGMLTDLRGSGWEAQFEYGPNQLLTKITLIPDGLYAHTFLRVIYDKRLVKQISYGDSSTDNISVLHVKNMPHSELDSDSRLAKYRVAEHNGYRLECGWNDRGIEIRRSHSGKLIDKWSYLPVRGELSYSTAGGARAIVNRSTKVPFMQIDTPPLVLERKK